MTRDELLKLGALRTTVFKYPDSDHVVVLQELSARQRGEVAALMAEKKGPIEINCRVIIMSARDDAGNPLFTVEDLPRVMDMNGALVEALANEIGTFSGSGLKKDSASTTDSSTNSRLA